MISICVVFSNSNHTTWCFELVAIIRHLLGYIRVVGTYSCSDSIQFIIITIFNSLNSIPYFNKGLFSVMLLLDIPLSV